MKETLSAIYAPPIYEFIRLLWGKLTFGRILSRTHGRGAPRFGVGFTQVVHSGPPLIPMSVQDETKARGAFGLWRGAREAHTRRGLQRAGNEARSQKDKRISLILNANWNNPQQINLGSAASPAEMGQLFPYARLPANPDCPQFAPRVDWLCCLGDITRLVFGCARRVSNFQRQGRLAESTSPRRHSPQ